MIRTESLTKRYGMHEALNGVTIDVPPASVFALVGPNGAGKSTLIKTLLNLIQPSAGHAEILGVDSRRLGARELAQVGYISESQKLPEWMKLSYFFRYAQALYPAWDAALAAELIQEYGLPLDRPLRHLSRGMKVKAALAASLAYRPRLIILDEPFSGLDVLVREQLIESIIDRTPEATVLLASHDLTDIESFATHVAYLNEGRLEFVEEMAALTGRFREVEVTSDEPLSSALPDTWSNVEAAGAVVRFVDTHYDAAECRRSVAERFSGVREVHTREMSLRAIFLALARSRRITCA